MRKIIRRADLRDITGFSDRTIDRKEAAGQFPQRIQLGGNSVGWYADEVEAWLDSCPRGPAEVGQARGRRDEHGRWLGDVEDDHSSRSDAHGRAANGAAA